MSWAYFKTIYIGIRSLFAISTIFVLVFSMENTYLVCKSQEFVVSNNNEYLFIKF